MVSEPARGAPGRVIASWREVERWWEPDGGVDLVWCRVEDCRGRQTVLETLTLDKADNTLYCCEQLSQLQDELMVTYLN